MNTLFKFIFGGIFAGCMLAMLFIGVSSLVIWWIEFSGSFTVMMIPFFIIGGLIGVSELENK